MKISTGSIYMFENLTVNKRLVAGFGLAAFTLLLVAGISYHNANLLIDTEHWVAHTHQVRTEFADLLSDLKDAETGQRGYLLTGEDSYLEPYKGAFVAIRTTLGDLKEVDARQSGSATAVNSHRAADRQQASRAETDDRSA
jgi:CHASE3 domain sensor protein